MAMEKRRLGKTGMTVSILGFGGSEIGYEGASAAVVEKLLNGAIDGGLNVIDTAECYAASEELIGKVVSARRKDYYLFTKCGHFNGWSRPDWTPPSLLKSIERSLKRLKTDCVDLVQLHSCSEQELRKGNVIDALHQARERGYTRYIGYSGDGKAALYAVQCGAFDTLQTSLSIADQEALELTLPHAIKNDIGVIAKRPIANFAWANGSRPPSDGYGYSYWERLRQLRYDFLEKNIQQSVATALRFTLTVPGVHTAIVGTSKPGRFAENAAALEAGPLPQELFDSIRSRWHQVAKRDWVGQQ
jgi:aryl-alcohol dehydrogenase-like predicted oxidoreductase